MKNLILLGLLIAAAFGFSILPSHAEAPRPPANRVARGEELLAKLQPYAGTYVLARKEDGTPCFNMLQAPGQEVRLNVELQEKDDEYGGKAGTVKVELQQFWEASNKWGRVFDRAGFFNVNEPKTSSRVGALKITHESSFDDTKEILTHESVMSKFLEGSSSARQVIELGKQDGEFTYTYTYWGKGTNVETGCRAVFRRKQPL